MQITPEIVTAAGSAILTIGGLIPVLKRYAPKVGQEIKKDAPVIAHEANAALEFVKHLAESPVFAGIAAKGKIEAHHVVSELEKSTVAKVASQVVQTFGRAYSDLTPNEKSAALIMARDVFKGAGMTVTDAQIEKALADVDKAVQELQANPIFKAIQQLQAASKAAQQAPAETAPITPAGQ